MELNLFREHEPVALSYTSVSRALSIYPALRQMMTLQYSTYKHQRQNHKREKKLPERSSNKNCLVSLLHGDENERMQSIPPFVMVVKLIFCK